ncbi:hypothetical protein TRFO_31571 [Tritrichomonas foetus]|uniref:Glycosyltransferase 2-like domain-containing protein n=1 Tax=Tritrichomonas foetus TaxID=1144522 RepID=A0A1J4JQU1_9EUKA|nr:hypothetical protein TRFO_31571 [Tritrichomonas foetus]|eukprot:OHT01543.1 hypothetical protein TRFO_31571 [Tritrichomonas foetus]
MTQEAFSIRNLSRYKMKILIILSVINCIVESFLVFSPNFVTKNDYLDSSIIKVLVKPEDFVADINLIVSRIRLLSEHYSGKTSIVITTFNRQKCFKRAFERLIENRPENSEIIVVDDASTETAKLEYLANITGLPNVTVIRHNQSYGAFHSKLDGFRAARGDYVMSCDDDDTFDPYYYKEIVSHIDYRYDFIVPLNNFMIRYFNLRNLTTIEQIVQDFHNHVAYAFRRSLIDGIEYPPKDVYIIRDDAPLTIPLYMKSSYDKFLFFENNWKYRLDRFCRARHESSKYRLNREKVFNGYYFLLNLTKNTHQTRFNNVIYKAYAGYLKAYTKAKHIPRNQTNTLHIPTNNGKFPKESQK